MDKRKDTPLNESRWCSMCAEFRNVYASGDGSSVPAGTVCCCHCQRVIESPGKRERREKKEEARP